MEECHLHASVNGIFLCHHCDSKSPDCRSGLCYCLFGRVVFCGLEKCKGIHLRIDQFLILVKGFTRSARWREDRFETIMGGSLA